MRRLYVSDLHFDHKGALKERPEFNKFNTVEEMNQALLDGWCEQVKPDDDVYILGDLFAYRYNPCILHQLTGNLTMICGNHEEEHWLKNANLPDHIQVIHGDAEVIDCQIPELQFEPANRFRRVRMCHFPRPDLYSDDPNTYVLYGHLHTNEPRKPEWRDFCLRRHALNASIDIIHAISRKYWPVTLDELIFYNVAWSTKVPWLKNREW